MFLEFFAAALFVFPTSPDIARSPGSLCTIGDKDFRDFRYEEQIPYCQRNVSAQLKRIVYEDYGVPEADRVNYTIDHILPLALGGNNARANLWPEHKSVKATRPQLEQQLYESLRKGEIQQPQALQIIRDAKFRK